MVFTLGFKFQSMNLLLDSASLIYYKVLNKYGHGRTAPLKDGVGANLLHENQWCLFIMGTQNPSKFALLKTPAD